MVELAVADQSGLQRCAERNSHGVDLETLRRQWGFLMNSHHPGAIVVPAFFPPRGVSSSAPVASSASTSSGAASSLSLSQPIGAVQPSSVWSALKQQGAALSSSSSISLTAGISSGRRCSGEVAAGSGFDQSMQQLPAGWDLVYLGLFLTKESRSRLMSAVRPMYGTQYGDHITVVHHPPQCILTGRLLRAIGAEGTLVVTGAYSDYEAQAVTVEWAAQQPAISAVAEPLIAAASSSCSSSSCAVASGTGAWTHLRFHDTDTPEVGGNETQGGNNGGASGGSSRSGSMASSEADVAADDQSGGEEEGDSEDSEYVNEEKDWEDEGEDAEDNDADMAEPSCDSSLLLEGPAAGTAGNTFGVLDGSFSTASAHNDEGDADAPILHRLSGVSLSATESSTPSSSSRQPQQQNTASEGDSLQRLLAAVLRSLPSKYFSTRHHRVPAGNSSTSYSYGSGSSGDDDRCSGSAGAINMMTSTDGLSTNAIPHVTVSVQPGVPAVKSNAMLAHAVKRAKKRGGRDRRGSGGGGGQLLLSSRTSKAQTLTLQVRLGLCVAHRGMRSFITSQAALQEWLARNR